MKKETFFLIACVLLLAIVSAAPTPPETPAQSTINDMPGDSTNPVPTPTSAFEGVKDKTDQFIETTISFSELPKPIASILRTITGITEDITLSQFIVFISITILFFLAIGNIFTLFSPFSKGTGTAIAALMTLIAGVIGILRVISIALLATAENIKLLAEWSTGALFVTVVIIVGLWFIFSKIADYARRKEAITKGKEQGLEAGVRFGFLGALKDIIKAT